MHDPPCHRLSVAALVRVALLAAAPWTTGVPAAAGTPPANAERDAYRDLQLTVHARKALQQDPALAPLNLGLRVRGGEARVWGPVPSEELIARALERVRAVQGILKVRNELHVAPAEKEPEPLLVPQTPAEPQRTASASPDPVSGSLGALTGRTIKASEVYPDAVLAPPAGGVALGPPVPLDAPAVPGIQAERPEPAKTEEPSVAAPRAAPPTEPLSVAIDRVRRSDPRFRGLRLDVRGTAVTVSGSPERGDDVMALAGVLSRLPGVGRVVTKTDGPLP